MERLLRSGPGQVDLQRGPDLEQPFAPQESAVRRKLLELAGDLFRSHLDVGSDSAHAKALAARLCVRHQALRLRGRRHVAENSRSECSAASGLSAATDLQCPPIR